MKAETRIWMEVLIQHLELYVVRYTSSGTIAFRV